MYDLLWTREERERVARTARSKIKEEAVRLRKAYPDDSEQEIWNRACECAPQAVADEVLGEIREDYAMFRSSTLVAESAASAKLWNDFGTAVTDALILPIANMAMKR
jgi:hypothetical protein